MGSLPLGNKSSRSHGAGGGGDLATHGVVARLVVARIEARAKAHVMRMGRSVVYWAVTPRSCQRRSLTGRTSSCAAGFVAGQTPVPLKVGNLNEPVVLVADIHVHCMPISPAHRHGRSTEWQYGTRTIPKK